MIDAEGIVQYNRSVMLPNDPYMLLSAVNMKLRDIGLSLEELCDREEASEEEVREKLAGIGYFYDESRRAFVVL